MVGTTRLLASFSRYNKDLKKFYKLARIVKDKGGYEVNLDHRKLKTPNGKLFKVPTESLALTVAHEWNSQDETIKRYNMPLTHLCNTAIDNPSERTKAHTCLAILDYLNTDTICFHAPEPPDLNKLQQERWSPIIRWAEQSILERSRFAVRIPVHTSLVNLDDVPLATRQVFERQLLSYDDWTLVGIEKMVTVLKSLLLSLSLVYCQIPPAQAVALSQLEQSYQTGRWGDVEWHHPLEQADAEISVSAAALFVQLLSEGASTKQLELF